MGEAHNKTGVLTINRNKTFSLWEVFLTEIVDFKWRHFFGVKSKKIYSMKSYGWKKPHPPFSKLFFLILILCRAKPTMNSSTYKCMYPKPDISYSVPQTSIAVQKHVNEPHWVTCSFTTKIRLTIVCLEKSSRDE